MNLLSEYNDKKYLYIRLEQEANFILTEEIEKNNIKISNIESRIKEYNSLADKVKRKKIVKPFETINDILGVRIICLFISDLSKIEEVIDTSFDLLDKDDKINSSVDSFGYMSIHYIVKLKNSYRGPRYDNILNIPFEIQVRTLAMHSWANISHFLSYKTEEDIPPDLQKDFNALSGLFYIADKHFELFYNQKQKVKSDVEQKLINSNEPLNQPINLDTLISYVKNKVKNREQGDDTDFSELVTELHKVGYTKLKEIDDIFNKTYEFFLLYEEQDPPKDENGINCIYADTGVIRTIMQIYDINYRNLMGFDESVNNLIEEYRMKVVNN